MIYILPVCKKRDSERKVLKLIGGSPEIGVAAGKYPEHSPKNVSKIIFSVI
jgi:hypothetical protein